jgi:hypothetical protein
VTPVYQTTGRYITEDHNLWEQKQQHMKRQEHWLDIHGKINVMLQRPSEFIVANLMNNSLAFYGTRRRIKLLTGATILH